MSRLRDLFARQPRDAELAEEIRAHIEERADEFMARGLSPADAMAAARRAFGNVAQVEERSGDVWRVPLESVLQDVRYALRLVRRYPAFSANVVLISALGIAAVTATFSLVSGILLAPLPFSSADHVFELDLRSETGVESAAIPTDAYLRLAAGSPVVEAAAMAEPGRVRADWNGEPTLLDAALAEPSLFAVYRVTPTLGRPFTEDEAGQGAPVVLLGNGLWRSRFAADSTVIGRQVLLDGAPHTVIGVMPPGFRAQFASEPDFWRPAHVRPAGTTGGRTFVNAVLRTPDSVTAVHAAAWLRANVAARMPKHGFGDADSVAATAEITPIAERIYGDVERPLQVLLGAVLLVLILVAANVATMILARSAARERELGVRRALGASVARQARQLVTESVALTAIGGVLGVGASWWIVRAVRDLGLRVLPRMDSVALDWRVLALAVAATIVTGVVGGLAPALSARRDANPAAGARVTGRRTSSALVVVQIALSVMLLVGAGLLVKGFLRVLPSDPGFAFDNRATIMVHLYDDPAYPRGDPAAAERFVADVSERMRAVPGVREVAAMSFVPFFGLMSSQAIDLPGRDPPDRPLRAFTNFITPNLLAVMRIPLRAGRAFTSHDDAGAEPVAIIDETAAARWWPGENALGRQVTLGAPDPATITVVGVMRDARLFGSDTRPRPELYQPMAQGSPGFASFIVHTAGPPERFEPDLKRAIWSVAPRLPIANSSDLETIAMDSVRRPRFFAWAMGIFAVVAIALSALAVYGLLTLDVAQRRQEIGIRLALGATGGRIGVLVVRRALFLGAAGMVIGIVLARGLSRYLESLLLEVTATDATVFVGTAVAALVVAAVASCAPAWRAVHVDPVRSLAE